MQIITQFNVDDTSRQAWLDEILGLAFPVDYDPRAMDVFVTRAAQAARRWLPVAAQQAVTRLADCTSAGALVVSNLPRDPVVPPMPASGYRPATKTTAVSEAVLLGSAALYGPVFTYAQEKRGCLPADVIPVAGLEQTQSNAGRADFLPHADNHFLKRGFVPEALFLAGVIDSPALTLLYPADAIVARLSPNARATLRLPKFELRAPASFEFGGYEIWSPARRAIFTDILDFCARVLAIQAGRG